MMDGESPGYKLRNDTESGTDFMDIKLEHSSKIVKVVLYVNNDNLSKYYLTLYDSDKRIVDRYVSYNK
jgi:hypothetical protein